MSIAVKSGLPSLGSTEGAVISADEVSVSEDGSAAASVGEDLPRGKSAYEIAKENGFNGTEAEWLASLKGEPGAPGAPGKDGENGKTPYVGDNGNWYIGADDTGKPSRGAKGEPGSPGAKGDKGDTGATPNLSIGTVTTLEAGQNATASMGGTAESPVLNLGIPKGADGQPGTDGKTAYQYAVEGGYTGTKAEFAAKLAEEYIPAPAAATVGQTIKVKAIDESGKPTAWEAADMPSGGADGSGVTEYHASNNLYDAENLVGTHTINGSSVSGLSNWIPVKAKTKYASDAHHTQYYFFDTEKNYLSGATYITSPVVVTAPQDGFLLIKTNGNTETIVVEGTDLGNHYEGYYALKESLTKRVSKADNNTWEGKKWLAIGDSLTDPAVASEGYPYIVSKALGLTLTNVGASGKVMNWFVDLIPDYADDFDLVTVMLGTNNQGYNCGIGSLNDGVDYTTNNSFYAQTQKVAEVLMAKYPTAVIAFITPIRRTGVGEQNNNADGYMINALSLTTEPYAEAVKEVADYYGLPCLDLYHNGINPKSEWMRQLYFVNSDGTHPNNKGHAKYIAPVIKAFLESLAPFVGKTVTYSVTNNLTNAENSNAATSVFEGSAYSANITATSGYVLSSVTVSMGGEDVTGTVYADGAITIGAVTGDIVITATATATSVTTYTITNTLTNATNSNSAASVDEGASYSATITANEGYELGEVTVTMGGTDISASAVSGGTITIESVTGNIVITATATKVDSGEPVLVHSYIGTSVPESGVLEDQTGSFDLTHNNGNKFFENYTDANGSAFALSTGDSASFKFVNAYRNTIYYSSGCQMNTSGVFMWHMAIGGNLDNSGRIQITPYGNPYGATSSYGDACPQLAYRQDDDGDGAINETFLYSADVVKKGETHTITVTVNAADKSIKMYVDGTIVIDEFMTTEPKFDGLTVYVNNDCPFDRLEVYRGIITDVT